MLLLCISNIFQIDLELINTLIDQYITSKQKSNKETLLKNIKNHFVRYINEMTIRSLQQLRFNPPPSEFLPNKMIYDRRIVRTANSNPKNPFKVFSELVK